jgi:hypothetical protein
MPTSMLDALADEAKAITNLSIEASRLTIEAVRRSGLLTRQIEHLASEDAARNEITNTPGLLPAAQIDGQGNQGSDDSAPGGAMALFVAESEQVGADVASEEREAPRVDPEATPDIETLPTIKDRFLDLWAETTDGVTALCRILACPTASGANYLVQARRDGDRRAAAGDLLRVPKDGPAEENRPSRARAKPHKPPLPAGEPGAEMDPIGEDSPPGTDLVRLHLGDCTVTHREQTIIVARHELRILLVLNSQMPTGVEPLFVAAKVLTGRRLDSEINKLNGRLRTIGVEIEKDAGPLYTLRRIAAVA